MCWILSQLPIGLLITEGLLIDGVILPVKQVNNWIRPRISKFPPVRQIASQNRLSRPLGLSVRINSPYFKSTKPVACFIGVFLQLAQRWRRHRPAAASKPTSLTRLQRKKWRLVKQKQEEDGGADQPVEENSFSRAEAAFLDESVRPILSSRPLLTKVFWTDFSN